jgi:succinate-semialdehyde dehydrogenase/glutarate-semialdehyde dehydrogenase
MEIPKDMFIDGQWVAASDGARREIINPATEERVDSVPVATIADLDRALEAAARGWRHWREVDAWTRSAALRRIAELVRARAEPVAEVLTEEQGKPIAEARA